MKFDFIIGNPPYQDETIGDNETYSPPIYHKFIDEAYKIGDVVELIHPARFLFNVGSTPKAWNKKMLEDEHLKILDYISESGDIFYNVKIRGGICISYHDKNKIFGAIRIFTPWQELNSIINKVIRHNDFFDIAANMYIQNCFNLENLYEDYPEYKKLIGSDGRDRRFETAIFDKIPIFREYPNSNDDIKVYGIVKKKRLFRYLPRKYVDFEHNNLHKYKVVLPKSSGEGVFGEALSPLDILEPYVAFTRSFISFGKFDTLNEAENCRNYIKTKFVRALLYAKKVTQDNPITTWACIPMQDFTEFSDINWSKSVQEIDTQLYLKYGLDEQEIDFIESHVKEMK